MKFTTLNVTVYIESVIAVLTFINIYKSQQMQYLYKSSQVSVCLSDRNARITSLKPHHLNRLLPIFLPPTAYRIVLTSYRLLCSRILVDGSRDRYRENGLNLVLYNTGTSSYLHFFLYKYILLARANMNNQYILAAYMNYSCTHPFTQY